MRISAKTEEEIARAHDRMRVQRARRGGKSLLLVLLLLGPGMLTMLGENDGPSMISYAATGTDYGIGVFVPFILLTFVMAYVVQETAMRAGIATQRGHAELIRSRFGDRWASFALANLAAGNVLTLAAEFVAIASGAAFLGIPRVAAIGMALAVTLGAFATSRYFTWERLALVLALGNLVFLPVALRANPKPDALLHAAATWAPMPHPIGASFMTLVLANIGATVTPWMIFFQQSTVVDKGLRRADLPYARIDTALGALLAAIVAIGALCAGAVLYAHHAGADSLRSGADFATALLPYLGKHASTLFAVGMIEAGLTASVTISASSGYAAGELFRSGRSLNRRFSGGALFYGAIVLSLLLAAGIVLVPGAPLFRLAIFANVAATALMIPALAMLFVIARDRALMGALANGRMSDVACAAVAAAICIAGAAYAIVAVVPQI